MSQFIRMINHCIVDFFVQQAEDSGYCSDQFLKDSPYLLGYGELDCLFGNLPEETSDCLVVAEAFCNGKYVVLYAAQCSGGNLRGEAGTLAFAETKICLTVLEHNFKSPASGIYLPCVEKIHSGIGCEQSVPFAAVRPAHKKDSYRNASERSVKHNIVAFELAAVLLQFELLSKLHKRGSGEVSVFGMVFCFAVITDLYHAEPMAFDMSAMDEPDNLLIGKPTVCQHIAEFYATSNGPFYHQFCKLDFGHVIFLLSLTEHLAFMFGNTAPFEFLGAHAVVAILPLLSDDDEVEKYLRHTVGNSHTEAFESEYRLVGQMRMNPSYFFYSPSCLLMVGIVKDKTYIIGFMVGTQMYTAPKLCRYMPECFPPVNRRIFHEAIEDILPCLDQRLECAILLIAVSIFYAEAREKKKTLEYSQQPVHAVTLACGGKCIALSHFDLRENRTYVLHGSCHIRFLKKVFDIRQKRSNFVYRHGFEYVLVWYLKFTHFLAIKQETMSFFYTFIFGNQYLRNLNN